MSDSGKHSALRQTSDGSFEIIFESPGLQEISEEEPSVAEVVAPPARDRTPRASNRVILITVGAIAVLLIVGAIGWFAVGPSTRSARDVDDVPGFRPYGGGGAAAQADHATPARPRPRNAVPKTDRVAPAAQPADEITESEPGWELTEGEEPDVVVEVEGTDTPEAPVVEIPAEEVPAEEVPAEEGTEEVADESGDGENGGTNGPTEGGDSRFRAIGGPKALNALRGADIGRGIPTPRVPSLGASPLAAERLKNLPIRRIRTGSALQVQEEENADEEVPEDETPVVDEEY